MKETYDHISRICSHTILKNYSTSFSLGTRIFPRTERTAITCIYGFVRLADEIVDTFHDYPQGDLFKEFKQDTWKALERRISTNPVLQAFQEVVHQYRIRPEHIAAFLSSMEADLTVHTHDRSSYDNYIFGSAEVVGLMCLHVFVKGDDAKFDELEGSARKLGSAFQKVNFLRDVREDNMTLDRQYFPGLEYGEWMTESVKRQIENEINQEFQEALEGIRHLRGRVRLGVWVAYVYYRRLLYKIQKVDPQDLRSRRIRVSNPVKFVLLFWTTVRFYLNIK